MLQSPLHWFLASWGVALGLALFGFLLCLSEGSTPFDEDWEREAGLVKLFFGYVAFGAVACLGLALLASPVLFFVLVLKWPWEKAALPGVITGIVLTVIALAVDSNRIHRESEAEKAAAHSAKRNTTTPLPMSKSQPNEVLLKYDFTCGARSKYLPPHLVAKTPVTTDKVVLHESE